MTLLPSGKLSFGMENKGKRQDLWDVIKRADQIHNGIAVRPCPIGAATEDKLQVEERNRVAGAQQDSDNNDVATLSQVSCGCTTALVRKSNQHSRTRGTPSALFFPR